MLHNKCSKENNISGKCKRRQASSSTWHANSLSPNGLIISIMKRIFKYTYKEILKDEEEEDREIGRKKRKISSFQISQKNSSHKDY